VVRALRLAKVKTPILILSGLAGTEDKVKGLGLGADDYLTKPFHRDEVVARIHAIVRRSRGHAQSVVTNRRSRRKPRREERRGWRRVVHLTGKEYQILEISLCAGNDAQQGNVLIISMAAWTSRK